MAAPVHQVCKHGKVVQHLQGELPQIGFRKCFGDKIEVGQENLPKKKKPCRYSQNTGCICFFMSDLHDENTLQA